MRRRLPRGGWRLSSFCSPSAPATSIEELHRAPVARARDAPYVRPIDFPALGDELAVDVRSGSDARREDRREASVADARPELSGAVVIVEHATTLATGRWGRMPTEAANDNALDDHDAHHIGLLDTLPLVPRAEESEPPNDQS